MHFRFLLLTLCTLVLPWAAQSAKADDEVKLTQYTMTDGALIRGMSDNGCWAVAYTPHPADAYYTYARVIDLTTHQDVFLTTQEEMEMGTESQANDITDDGLLVVGSYKGQPATWSATTAAWTFLPIAGDKAGGRATAVTPDGRYAVGVCTNGGLDEVPALWDLTTATLIPTPNLPTHDLWGDTEGMLRFTGISADGRYITGCMDYSYPQCVLYFVYDTTADSWDPIAFDYDAATHRYTAKSADVLTLDGIVVSPSGEWVGGTVHNVDDVKHPFRYHLPTQTFENFCEPDDLDKACVTIDNEGTLYAATPAVNPSRSLYVRRGNYWYGLDEMLRQAYGMDFYKFTSFAATGFPVAVSADCQTLAANAYIQEDNYLLSLPEPFSQVCSRINLLEDYTPSMRSGAKVGKMASVELRFTRNVAVTGQTSDVVLRDADGQIVKTAISFQVNAANPKTVNIGFRTYTLEKGRDYTLEIPAGTISLAGDASQQNHAIALQYTGLGTDDIMASAVSPTDGSTLGHVDMTTSPVVFSFPCDVRVAEDAVAYLYCNDEAEPAATLQLLAGITATTAHQLMAYPTSSLSLYRGNSYRIVLPQGSATDLSGYVKTAAAEVTYEGGYEQTIVSDNSRIYMENFAGGMGNVMLFDADRLTPTAEMQAWGFDAANTAWWYAADDDFSNPCAVSHSMYSPAGKSNDWMVTPQLSIPDEKCYLTFKAQSFRTAKTDRLKVIIWEEEQKFNVLSQSLVERMAQEGRVVVDEVLSPGAEENRLEGDWQDFTVLLDGYAGRKIYIAFVNENSNASAIFVTDVYVCHDASFQIQLSGVSESCVAQTEQAVSGKVCVQSAAEPYHSATLSLCDDAGQELAALEFSQLSLQAGDELPFAFGQPLALKVGRENRFTLHVRLQGTTRTDEDYLALCIRNLAFRPTKRVVLEENTGMACNNCPLGHLAIEYLRKLYGPLFIPLCYHTYTGDAYESGMTDYVQYFLGLTAAPTGIVARTWGGSPMTAVTADGLTDYSFNSSDGTCWADLVGKSMAVLADADVALTAVYDEASQNVRLDYDVRYALSADNVNVGLLFVVTEDGLSGYQSNKFYTETDDDLGPWRKDGEYGKSTVAYTFDDVARALYPANAYYGLSGLIPTSVEEGVSYSGSITMDCLTDLSRVRDIRNCQVTCMLIDRETGRLVNAAQAPVADASAILQPDSDARVSIHPRSHGVIVQTVQPARVRVVAPDGRLLAHVGGSGMLDIPLSCSGIVIVEVATADGIQCRKLRLP